MNASTATDRPLRTIPPRGPEAAVLWAFFLGCSWTWIIGMFFPVLLVRDFGLWGWVAFATPNAAGAAAMGWVLRTPQAAASLREKHAGAVRGFTDVTLAFHVLVLLWLGYRLFGPAVLAALAVPTLILPAARRRAWGARLPLLAIGVALLSWGCFFFMTGLPDASLGASFAAPAGLPDRLGPEALLAFGFAAAVGFACCPYLDATFLRARAATDAATGRTAFTLGFLGVFLSMIVGSLLYAGLLIPAFAGEDPALPPVWSIVLGLHVLVQVVFTLACHLRERGDLDPDGRHLFVPAALVLLALLAVLFGDHRLAWLAGPGRPAGPTVGEAAYRLFLLAYGMVFPAYVWLCVLRRGPLHRGVLVRFAVTASVAMGLGVAGFIAGRWPFLLGALAVVTVAKAVPVMAPPAARADAGAPTPPA
ncbi:hypothetical protein [Phycisphaera mikurensis]|uniref:Uncharacterized protein n=1 Tax=Phycisphaera mikurensis (strain NBRC 102666 / KCTC 22515 / FYK2301M01) TaxID=1142394 RepID=I0IBA3_PHYMF|nr:hypothetical protein [Phycisphaera mikurensis]MBB6443036.1 hypothetical protein [Phycisphaera mikurensis]BAM02541.1 hypothetical protein PSMK_03820 [Phycisphaera mikurensis NBRC 102666]